MYSDFCLLSSKKNPAQAIGRKANRKKYELNNIMPYKFRISFKKDATFLELIIAP